MVVLGAYALKIHESSFSIFLQHIYLCSHFQVMWRQMQQKIVLLSQENNELKGRIMMLEGELARAYHRHAGMPAPAGGGGGPMVSFSA